MNFNRIKNVVVVYGESGTGKTTTLCKLCESLLTKYPAQFVLRTKRAKQRFPPMPLTPKGHYRDVVCAVHCKDKFNNDIMIGIGTAGDDWDSVERNFMFFDNVFPQDEFAYVFIAIRKRKCKDELDIVSKSLPLMALERMEVEGRLNVNRPFVNAPNPKGLAKSATKAAKTAFLASCATLANQLEAKI